MTTTLQYPTLMEQTIAAVQELSTKFNRFEDETKNDLREIKEGLLGNRYNKKGLVDRTGILEERVGVLEEDKKTIKSMVAGAKFASVIYATAAAAIFEFIWKVFFKQ